MLLLFDSQKEFVHTSNLKGQPRPKDPGLMCHLEWTLKFDLDLKGGEGSLRGVGIKSLKRPLADRQGSGTSSKLNLPPAAV